jgi:hypothetical protein
VVAVVMDFHRQRVKVGFEGGLVVGQRREFVCHGFVFLFVVVGPICAGQVASPAAENQVRTINCSAAAKSFLFRRRAWQKKKPEP